MPRIRKKISTKAKYEIHLLCDPAVTWDEKGMDYAAAFERKCRDIPDESWLDIGPDAHRWSVRPLKAGIIERIRARASVEDEVPDIISTELLGYASQGSRYLGPVELAEDEEFECDPSEIFELAHYIKLLSDSKGLGVPLADSA